MAVTFSATKRAAISKDPANWKGDESNQWVGFSALYTVDGGYLTAEVIRESIFSFFPKLMVEIEMWKDGYELPK